MLKHLNKCVRNGVNPDHRHLPPFSHRSPRSYTCLETRDGCGEVHTGISPGLCPIRQPGVSAAEIAAFGLGDIDEAMVGQNATAL